MVITANVWCFFQQKNQADASRQIDFRSHFDKHSSKHADMAAARPQAQGALNAALDAESAGDQAGRQAGFVFLYSLSFDLISAFVLNPG